MGDSTDAIRETDVSSTTADVPEGEEVSGSQGDFETIVKKTEEVELVSNNKQPLEVLTTERSTSDKSPIKDQTSYTDISPNKFDSPQKPSSPINNPPAESSPIRKLSTPIPINDPPAESSPIRKLSTPIPINDPPAESTPIRKPSTPISINNPPAESSPIRKPSTPISTINPPAESSPVRKPDTPKPINNPSAKSSPVKDSELLLKNMEKPILISPTKLELTVTAMQEKQTKDVLEVQQSETVDSSCNIESQISLRNEADATSVDIVKSDEKSTPEKNIPIKKSDTKEVDSEDTTEASMSNTGQEKLNDIDKVDSTDSSKHEAIIDKNCPKMPNSIEINPEKEASNDSQLDTNSDMSEKDRKSISRELKSLIKSAKESKIINECNQLTTKMRKSRSALDSSNTSLNTSMEPDKIDRQRRASCCSQKSNSSEKAEKVMKRSMRSQNPEFVNKVKQFLNSVTGKAHKNETETGNLLDDVLATKHKDNQNSTSPSSPKKRMLKPSEDLIPDKVKGKLTSDSYCWRCHWGVEDSSDKTHPAMYCTVCPRSFHYKCFTAPEKNKLGTENIEKNWVCPECRTVLQAESSDSRSPAMKKLSLGTLCELLNYALERMMAINGVEPFTHPVDRTAFPTYDKFVIHPMDLSIMKENIKKGLYGSTEAFHADALWILHNSIIFNTMQSKLTVAARSLIRSCKSEMGEIEACPECYLAAHSRKPTWFIDVCSSPHILLWAKLKGFPYWPAKGMSVNSSGLVDVRFFGAHDRAWVPAKDCFLYSEKDPNNFRTKRQDIIDSMAEAEQHIRNISRKYGKFVYPPFRTPFETNKMTEQIKRMIPSFEGEANIPVKNKAYAASPNISKIKGSKTNEGDASDTEVASEANTNTPAKSAKTETVKIAQKPQDYAVDTTPMEIDKAPTSKPSEMMTRKRRRSELEEAVITILESGPKDKRQKLDTSEKQAEPKKTDKAAEPPQTNTNSPQVDKQKPKENEQGTPKSKSKDTPSGKNKTPTFVSKTPKINAFKFVLTPKSKTPKSSTPKSTDKSAKKTELKTEVEDPNRSQSTTPKSHKKKEKPLEVKFRTVSTPDKPNNTKNIRIVPVQVTSKPVAQKETNSNKSVLRPQQGKSSPVQKSTKERIQFDDDTSLAVLARETSKTKSQNIVTNHTGLPTISCVRSLSDTSSNSSKSNKNLPKPVVTSEPPKVITPTTTDSAKNSKETANKSQKQNESLVGKVGVRSFARMTSPSVEVPVTNNIQVEVKSEPIDLDDADRQVEKMDLMNAFRLRPVNQVTPPVSNLRDVRINKIVITPPNARKSTSKPPDGGRNKAKKSCPASKKDDGRSELNSKNSMVYIPIQPPTSQAPVRPQRPVQNGPITSTAAVRASISVSSGINQVNTVTTPLIPNSIGTTPVTSSNIVQGMSSAMLATNQTLGSVSGNMPLTTMPMLATMNGQWTLMPIMSVGGVDNTASPTLVNGIPDRSAPAQSIIPISNLTLTANTTNLNTNVITSSQVQRPTESGLGELPRLQQRPLGNPFDSRNPPDEVPTPSSAGPLTKKLNQNAVKLSDFFRHLLEDTITKVDDPTALLTAKSLQLEEANWKHKHELDELIHGHNLMLTEMRLSFEKDKTRAVNEAKKAAHLELEMSIRQTKLKQWCSNCLQEAQFYCCWNTSYCNYNCQRKHWPQHFNVCTQQKNKNKNGQEMSLEPESRLQPQPEQMPKITKNPTPPALTVGGKVVTPEKNQKSAIIMSMVQDSSGTTAIKCLGTYKDPTYSNKQIINNEESQNAQSFMSSGGYIIVGGTDISPLITQNQRMNFFST